VRTTDVAIIGAGFSGTMLAWHLGRAGVDGILIGDAETFGRGRAYSTERFEHLLNVPTGGMSAFPDWPDDFQKWLSTVGHDSEPNSFAPRTMYGHYLKAICDRSKVVKLGDTVEVAKPTPQGWDLSLRSGYRVMAGRVILATGHRFPATPSVFTPLWDRLIVDPYAPRALAGIPPHATVMVVGTGLTAVDAIATLHQEGHRGRIVAVSRNGRWPAKQQLDDDKHVLAGWPEKTARGSVKWLREEIEIASLRGSNWRRVFDAVRLDTPRMWGQLPTIEQARLVRHARNLWDVSRHQMPPKSETRLDQLRSAGVLTSLAGRIGTITETDSAYEISIRIRDGKQSKLVVDYVILCTGTATAPRSNGNHLLDQLLRDGEICSDHLGIGVLTDANARCVRADGRIQDTLRAVGPLRCGTLWENVAVPELRIEAASVTANILSDKER
jgi:uncharacterized NAD(P)/FAD-binding protein YdhS